MILTQEMRIGVQFVIEGGDRDSVLQIKRLIAMMSLLLETAIPVLLAIQDVIVFFIAFGTGVRDASREVRSIQVRLPKDLLLMKSGLILLLILVEVLVGELK